jgi:hypothetical protein
MRIHNLGLRSPDRIPVAGVTLRELMSEVVSIQDVTAAVGSIDGLDLRDGDEIWRFRTPAWTWPNMCGVAGFVVLRNGLASHWIATRIS